MWAHSPALSERLSKHSYLDSLHSGRTLSTSNSLNALELLSQALDEIYEVLIPVDLVLRWHPDRLERLVYPSTNGQLFQIWSLDLRTRTCTPWVPLGPGSP